MISLEHLPSTARWAVLCALTALLVFVLATARLPAAFLVASIAASITLSVLDGPIGLPRWTFALAQGVVGCMIAHAFPPAIFATLAANWPALIVGVLSVLGASTTLGWMMARHQVLPATTAIWGSAPGAATAMVLMAEDYGADMRLVAFMQYLRVVIVAIVASAVARIWAPHEATPQVIWLPSIHWGSMALTFAIIVLAGGLARRSKLPAPFLLGPMLVSLMLSDAKLVDIVLPPWLLGASYIIVGWAIGLRFTRPILRNAAQAFPVVAGAILILVAICGGFSVILHEVWGIDALSAYLAMSPGGADTVAIIASSSHVDIAFVLAMQMSRFFVILLVGPALTRRVADRFQARRAAATLAE